MRQWCPVMRRHAMPIDIMVSPETQSIQPSMTLQGGVKATIPTLHRSISPVLSRRNNACAIAIDQSRSFIRLYKPGSTSLLNRGETCAITRHDKMTPATVVKSKYIGQQRANYNTENLLVKQLPRIITTSTDEVDD